MIQSLTVLSVKSVYSDGTSEGIKQNTLKLVEISCIGRCADPNVRTGFAAPNSPGRKTFKYKYLNM
ncbi:hypothetical protein RvY_19040 [Ramazzottius varieornatus]|uniref:Uncharacterized protein n=1 Tax=Ramazzottius varieornatus TaxID=947166 RepID=A0A1D1W7Z6_RAMVA|nr:hypothetical protein RvY_19040 [Ramazzottius varieornatus]